MLYYANLISITVGTTAIEPMYLGVTVVDIAAIAGSKQMSTNYDVSIKKLGQTWNFTDQFASMYDFDNDVLTLDNDCLLY